MRLHCDEDNEVKLVHFYPGKCLLFLQHPAKGGNGNSHYVLPESNILWERAQRYPQG